MKVVELPSGAELKISLAPFADGRELYQVISDEIKDVDIDQDAELNFDSEIPKKLLKDLICTMIGSRKVDRIINKCMQRALYNNVKITDATWEPEEARQDYITACVEVARENLRPFMKSLLQGYSELLLQVMQKNPESK